MVRSHVFSLEFVEKTLQQSAVSMNWNAHYIMTTTFITTYETSIQNSSSGGNVLKLSAWVHDSSLGMLYAAYTFSLSYLPAKSMYI